MNFMRLSLGIATIAVGISSCAAPANDAASTPTSHDEAPSWTMPTPGAFDPNVKAEDVFHPCTDVPDEALAEIGYRKSGDRPLALEPFACEVSLASGESDGGSIDLFAWISSVEQLVESSVYSAVVPIEGLPGAFVASSKEFGDKGCDVVIETNVGTIGAGKVNVFGAKNGEDLCEQPKEIITHLFRGTNESTDQSR